MELWEAFGLCLWSINQSSYLAASRATKMLIEVRDARKKMYSIQPVFLPVLAFSLGYFPLFCSIQFKALQGMRLLLHFCGNYFAVLIRLCDFFPFIYISWFIYFQSRIDTNTVRGCFPVSFGKMIQASFLLLSAFVQLNEPVSIHMPQATSLLGQVILSEGCCEHFKSTCMYQVKQLELSEFLLLHFPLCLFDWVFTHDFPCSSLFHPSPL